jgi:hypothetical protein
MSAERVLPAAFADLQPWVAAWALDCERERFRRLRATSLDELRAFYDAMLPRSAAVADHLAAFDLAGLPEAERTLFDLLMTFIETAHPIELKWPRTDMDPGNTAARLAFGDGSCAPPV